VDVSVSRVLQFSLICTIRCLVSLVLLGTIVLAEGSPCPCALRGRIRQDMPSNQLGGVSCVAGAPLLQASEPWRLTCVLHALQGLTRLVWGALPCRRVVAALWEPMEALLGSLHVPPARPGPCSPGWVCLMAGGALDALPGLTRLEAAWVWSLPAFCALPARSRLVLA